MSGKQPWTGSDHYNDMDIQPFEVFHSMGMLWEYCITASIKYLMRGPSRDTREECRKDIVKAIHCAQKALEVFDENS